MKASAKRKELKKKIETIIETKKLGFRIPTKPSIGQRGAIIKNIIYIVLSFSPKLINVVMLNHAIIIIMKGIR